MRVRARRPDQNRGLRSPVAKHVEDQTCPARDGNHLLRNKDGVTRCCGCLVTWAELDGVLNGFTRGDVA